MIREFQVVGEVTLFLKGFNLWTRSLQVGKNLCTNTVSQIGCFCQQYLVKFDQVLDHFLRFCP